MKNTIMITLLTLIVMTANAQAEVYKIDTKGMHAAIQFKIKHLGYSWLHGRFNRFRGQFEYDEKAPEKASINVLIDTSSVDSNHAERDKHLRSDDFLDVKTYPEAAFISTSYTPNAQGGAELKGKFTLHGVTRDISIAVQEVGAGPDPWGGYRRGFSGTTRIKLSDYNIKRNLGPQSQYVDLTFSIEGMREK